MNRGRLARIWIALLMALAVSWSAPAAAQSSTGEYRRQLDSIALEMRALWGELDRFQVRRQYCKPPQEPNKAEDQAKLDDIARRVQDVTARYNSTSDGLMTFLGHNHRLYAELMVNGVDPSSRAWWRWYETNRKRMNDELARKKAALAAAPEVNCGPPTKPQTTGTTGRTPPVTTPPPAPPVQYGQPVPPTYQPVTIPTLPRHFCSEAEKLALMQAISAESAKANDNATKAGMFKTDVAFTILKIEQAGQPVPAGLRSLERRADSEVREHQAKFDELHRLHQEASKVPVIDCSKQQPQQEPPRQDLRTGQTTPRTPTTPGLSPADESAIGRQQSAIDSFEKALADLKTLVRQRRCREAWDLVDELDEWFGELRNPEAMKAATGRAQPAVPPALLDQWDRQVDEILEDCPDPDKTLSRLDAAAAAILLMHNQLRAEIGLPPLRWDPRLAANAALHAKYLATTGQVVHAPREGRGVERENLSRGNIGWSPQQLMGNWAREKQNFIPGVFPNVSRTGNWNDVAHYSQIVWPTTTTLGCGIASGGGFQWLVCRYSPGGNKDGHPVGVPATPVRNERGR